MPELTITAPNVHTRVDSNTLTMSNHATVDLNPIPESTFSPVRDFGFGLWPSIRISDLLNAAFFDYFYKTNLGLTEALFANSEAKLARNWFKKTKKS
jgi:hypothetical protein